ncbi:hypothetical protein QFC19_004992 [Naganishia cerealis]|uniref:Uncharacterized protein n=1 Tax=Naganishia cerealis TaxID=610337 RepID=A0ACC2VSZ5_9TREE|nr:hypothetical protein QFC19_004992 [Naganishia cerealis]
MSTLAYIATPPPTPHQLAIAHLASRLFPPRDVEPVEIDAWFNKNARYYHAMLRLVSREALFDVQPSSFRDLMAKVTEITALAKPVEGRCKFLHLAPQKTLTRMPEIWADLQTAFELMEHIPDVYYEREDEAYVSPLGTFLRKVYLGYKTLSFQQTDILREQVLEWCSPPSSTVELANVETQAHTDNNGTSQRPLQGIQADLVKPNLQEDQQLSQNSSGFVNQNSSQMMNLAADTQASMPAEGFTRPEHNPTKRRKLVNKFTELDDTLDTRVRMFKDYQLACVRGDYSLALHSLDRFYNYRFPGHDKKLHQHALLNLASFHYNTGGLETARHILHEAIKVARTEGDQQCLLHCVSLSRRIEAETTVPVSSVLIEGLPPHAADVGSESEVVPPIDELWNIKRRLDLGETLPHAYSRIWMAAAREESIKKTKRNYQANRLRVQQPQPSGQAVSDLHMPDTLLAGMDVIHSVQASLWHMFGSTVLGDLHERLSLRTMQSPSQQLLLSISVGRAQRYTDALAVLLDERICRNLSIVEYHRWVHEIWSLVELIVKRCGVDDMLDTCKHFQLPIAAYRQLGAGGPLRLIPDPSQKLVFDAFRRDADQPDKRTTDKLASHLDAAESASIDRGVQINFAHPSQTGNSDDSSLITIAMREVEGIWDKILASEDDELIFSGAYVLGSAKLKQEPDVATEFAKLALIHAMRLGHQKRIASSAKILALAFHITGRQKQRDIVASFWSLVHKAKSEEDWHESKSHNMLMTEILSGLSNESQLGTSRLLTHELNALRQSVSLLPEIIARVGVAVSSGQTSVYQ